VPRLGEDQNGKLACSEPGAVAAVWARQDVKEEEALARRNWRDTERQDDGELFVTVH
jgi:hypothetical protein